MPQVGDVIELTSLAVSQAAVPSINVFHYRVVAAGQGLTPAQFINAFRVQVVQSISEVTATTGWLNQGVTYLNLTDGLEYAADSLTDTGERAGDPLPPFVVASFLLRRSTRATRNGHKRFGALSETDVTGGLPAAGLITACEQAAQVIEAGLTISNPATVQVAELVIIRRRAGIVPLYTQVNPVSSVEFRGIGSQNSRKIPFTSA